MGSRQSSLSPMDKMAYEYVLSRIPSQCQQDIRKIPEQQFLTIYGKHMNAETHLDQKEYLAAITNECEAIYGLESLLNHQKDHFIFDDMNKLLSICYWSMGSIELAFERSIVALNIRIKHTPMDATEISLQYFRLSLICMVKGTWKEAEECLMKAIDKAQSSTALTHSYTQELEETLSSLRQRILENSRQKPLIYSFAPDSYESQEDYLRRTTIEELIPRYNDVSALKIDIDEYERLPNKQTEVQVTDEILQDVLKSLDRYLKEDLFLSKFSSKGGCVSFISAYFKATRMKTSQLSPAIIEAALTIIIDRINDEVSLDNEKYSTIKQSSYTLSYTDNDECRSPGVRVFQVKGKILLVVDDMS
uniref:Uncharacterized protein n=1 Tax=Adineta vaga TaxID=104782 RepID=B5AH79_ADIVA|nr:hypothetical protein 19 [Adineta vaga]